jgi:DNA-binding CsgD family transcriptional regulator
MEGQWIRLNRLFSGSRRAVIVAVDHGEFFGPTPGIIDLPEAIQSLTVREREVLFRVATGADDDSIARSLYISPHTVRTHVGNVLRKLGVHSRSEAARLALAAGLHSDNVAQAIQIEGPGWSR